MLVLRQLEDVPLRGRERFFCRRAAPHEVGRTIARDPLLRRGAQLVHEATQRLTFFEPARERRPLGDEDLVHDLDGRAFRAVGVHQDQARANELIEDALDFARIGRELEELLMIDDGARAFRS